MFVSCVTSCLCLTLCATRMVRDWNGFDCGIKLFSWVLLSQLLSLLSCMPLLVNTLDAFLSVAEQSGTVEEKCLHSKWCWRTACWWTASYSHYRNVSRPSKPNWLSGVLRRQEDIGHPWGFIELDAIKVLGFCKRQWHDSWAEVIF